MPMLRISARLTIVIFFLCCVRVLSAENCAIANHLTSKTESRFPGHAVLQYENRSDGTVRIRLVGAKGFDLGEQVFSSISLAAHGVATMNLPPDRYTVAWFADEHDMQVNEQEDQSMLMMGAVGKLYMASTTFPHLDSDTKQNLEVDIKPNTKTLLTFEGCSESQRSNTPTDPLAGRAEKGMTQQIQSANESSEPPPADYAAVKVFQTQAQSLSPIRDCAPISSREHNLAPLSKFCNLVRDMDHALPDFTCRQTTERYLPIWPGRRNPELRRSDDPVQDTITATVTYENGSDEYSDVKIGDRSIESSRLDLTGPISTGDFGSVLLSVFRQENAATFAFREGTDGPKGREYAFDFRIPAATNHTFRYYETGAETHPDVSGTIFVNADTGEVRAMNLLASPINFDFSADHVRFNTLFRRVPFGEAGEFVLPTQSESVVCARKGPCWHNITRWTNCKRLAAKSRIILSTR
ncbi:MAG TPA: hypothetical protein VJT08_10170 [Terriglobales bacterium]|nr:hypothetical protein [Terriglobales bacterium]